jgi:hypothetical protein
MFVLQACHHLQTLSSSSSSSSFFSFLWLSRYLSLSLACQWIAHLPHTAIIRRNVVSFLGSSSKHLLLQSSTSPPATHTRGASADTHLRAHAQRGCERERERASRRYAQAESYKRGIWGEIMEEQNAILDTTGNYRRMVKQEVHIMYPNLTITARWNVGTTTSRSPLFRPTLHFLTPFWLGLWNARGNSEWRCPFFSLLSIFNFFSLWVQQYSKIENGF